MKILDAIKQGNQFISLEYFPPKAREEWPAFFKTVERLTELDPLFVSVTYGAGGSTHSDSLEIVTRVKKEFQKEVMAHLTCIGSSEETVRPFLEHLAAAGVSNVLALRGDPPAGESAASMVHGKLKHASDLVNYIRDFNPGSGIAVACYPETHPEAVSPEYDLAFLKLKLDMGADFAVSQLFFDNALFHDFVRRAQAAGITKPLIPGILPVVSLKVVKRIVSMCGATIPPKFMAELEEADRQGGVQAVHKVGVAHARKQAEELLASGVPGVHVYTLNRSDAVLELADGLF